MIQANPVYHQTLSTLMLDAEHVHTAVALGLTSDAFPDNDDQVIFLALRSCAIEERSTSLDSVWLRLNRMGDEANGISIVDLTHIAAMVPAQATIRPLAERVIGIHRQKKLTAALKAAVEASEAQEYDFASLWAGVEPHLRIASESAASQARRTWAEMCNAAIKQEREPDLRPTISTGIPGLDQEFSPIRPGLIVLAARPGFGKTALALQLAENVSRSGKMVAFFSLEMSGEDLATRLALQMAGVDAFGDHPKAVALRIAALERLAKIKNLDVTDMEESTAFSLIEARCRLLATKPNGLGVIVIDYLQLITPPTETAKAIREQQVAAMTRRLKLLSGSLATPVVLLCQLNRESEKEGREPRLSDLRESGSIEQDADRVWFIHPHVEKDGLGVPPGAARIPVMLIQAKCRGGPPNVARKLIFDRPVFKFHRAA